MGLVFKVGEHEQFKAVPQGFPQCGDWMPSSSNGVIDTKTDNPNETFTTTPDPMENEVAIKRTIQSAIFEWFPQILHEFRMQSSSSTCCPYQILVLTVCLIAVVGKHAPF